MTTIDERGRNAAATLRATMADDFDVDAGLTQVRAEQDLVDVSHHESPRHRWMFAVAAAVTVGLVGAGVLALQNRDTDVNVTDTPTSVATTPVTIVATTTSPTTMPAPSTVPQERAVTVADVVETVEPVHETVATLGFGDGPGQLAVESCQECEPARPWAPVQLPDGRVLIADTANGRWMIVDFAREGSPARSTQTTEVQWPTGVVAVDQPLIDDAGTVYVIMAGPLGFGGQRSNELWVLDPDNLATPLSQHPVTTLGSVQIELTPTEVWVGGAPIEGITPVIDERPTVEYLNTDPSATILRVLWQGTSATFDYGSVSASLFGPVQLPDGSVMTYLLVDGQEFVDRLTPDGQVHRMPLPPAGSEFAAGWVDDQGFYRLESGDPTGWKLVHYALP